METVPWLGTAVATSLSPAASTAHTGTASAKKRTYHAKETVAMSHSGWEGPCGARCPCGVSRVVTVLAWLRRQWKQNPKAVSWPRRQWKHKAKAVPWSRRQGKHKAKAVSCRAENGFPAGIPIAAHVAEMSAAAGDLRTGPRVRTPAFKSRAVRTQLGPAAFEIS